MIVRELFAKLGIEIDEAAFKAADAAVDGLKHGFLAIGAAVGAARLAIVGAVKATAEYSSEIHDLSAATGVSTETLQTLGYVGKLAGTSMEEMAQALVHLSRSAYEASTTGGPAGAAFYRLGIDAYDASGKVKDINVLLGEVSAKLGQVQNPTEKVALSLALLGRGGARVTQAMGHFGNNLEEAQKQARALGVVLDEKTIEAGNRMEESIHRMNFALKGFVYAIGAPLLGRMRAMVEGWVRWVEVNRGWLALKIDRAFLQLSAIISDVVAVAKLLMNSGLRPWFIGLGSRDRRGDVPLTALAALLALVAQDVYLFFKNPNADTLTGSLVKGFHKLGEAVKAHGGVLGFLYDETREFITWLVEQFTTIPDRVAKAMPRHVIDALMGGKPGDVLARETAGPPLTRNDNWLQALVRRMLPSPDYYGGLDDAGLQAMVGAGYTPSMSGVFRAPQLLAPQFHAEFNFYGAMSGDPQQAGPWRDQLDDWWYSKVAEAQATTVR
jgi:hypothetical protein